VTSALFVPLLLVGLGATTHADDVDDGRMRWFEEAKLGIFIHWGIYAVDGISESWSFHNRLRNPADYPPLTSEIWKTQASAQGG
jgi:alpha-L-fucosidase